MIKKTVFWSKKKIIRYIESISDNHFTSFFRLGYDGQSYAGNNKSGKAHRNTRVSIMIPKNIAKNNLKFMREWEFLIIGVRRI